MASKALIVPRFETRGMVSIIYGEQQKYRNLANQIVKAENEKAAAFIADAMAAVVEDKAGHLGTRQRAQRGDERLPTALRDDRNWTASSTGFGVGIASWLKQSPAKLYWRRIDKGHGPQEMLAARFFTGPGPGTNGKSGSGDRLIQGLAERGHTIMTSPFPAFDFSNRPHLRDRLRSYGLGQRYVESLNRAGIKATLR